MRSCAIAALVGTVTASPAYTFTAGEVPHCKVLANGATAIEYTSDMHPSFKCTHTGSTCVCSNPHPTHHTGGCKEFDHTDGTNHKTDGDCTDSGLNAIDGAWSGYTYGICSKSCGTGTQSMTRACDSPAPFNGGADCAGSTSTSQNCNTHACPVDGAWSGWTTSTCSVNCGDGTTTSTRTCNGQANGGAACAGDATTTSSCNLGSCSTWQAASTDRDTFNADFVANGGLVERTCPGCGADHQTIVYKRTSALPAGKDWYQLFMQDWFSSQNVINTDFKLFSSVSNAETDTNAWQYCNYDDTGVGFPRDCGKTGGVGGQWNSLTRGGQSATWEMPQ